MFPWAINRLYLRVRNVQRMQARAWGVTQTLRGYFTSLVVLGESRDARKLSLKSALQNTVIDVNHPLVVSIKIFLANIPVLDLARQQAVDVDSAPIHGRVFVHGNSEQTSRMVRVPMRTVVKMYAKAGEVLPDVVALVGTLKRGDTGALDTRVAGEEVPNYGFYALTPWEHADMKRIAAEAGALSVGSSEYSLGYLCHNPDRCVNNPGYQHTCGGLLQKYEGYEIHTMGCRAYLGWKASITKKLGAEEEKGYGAKFYKGMADRERKFGKLTEEEKAAVFLSLSESESVLFRQMPDVRKWYWAWVDNPVDEFFQLPHDEQAAVYGQWQEDDERELLEHPSVQEWFGLAEVRDLLSEQRDHIRDLIVRNPAQAVTELWEVLGDNHPRLLAGLLTELTTPVICIFLIAADHQGRPIENVVDLTLAMGPAEAGLIVEDMATADPQLAASMVFDMVEGYREEGLALLARISPESAAVILFADDDDNSASISDIMATMPSISAGPLLTRMVSTHRRDTVKVVTQMRGERAVRAAELLTGMATDTAGEILAAVALDYNLDERVSSAAAADILAAMDPATAGPIVTKMATVDFDATSRAVGRMGQAHTAQAAALLASLSHQTAGELLRRSTSFHYLVRHVLAAMDPADAESILVAFPSLRLY